MPSHNTIMICQWTHPRIHHGCDYLYVHGLIHVYIHWYSNALCLLFPSLYEGFGLPVLDAFSSNCPVACSNTSSLPEVGQDGAAYFQPNSIESMRETIQRLLESEEWRTHLIERGRQRLASFSWLRTAKETIDVYHAALRSGKI